MRLLIAMGLICGLCSLGLYATAQKKVIHRNAAARSKSRLTRAVRGLSSK